jgi:hypothetical protein
LFRFLKGSRYTDRLYQIGTRPDVGGKFNFCVTSSGLPQAVVSRSDDVPVFERVSILPTFFGITLHREILDQTVELEFSLYVTSSGLPQAVVSRSDDVPVFERVSILPTFFGITLHREILDQTVELEFSLYVTSSGLPQAVVSRSDDVPVFERVSIHRSIPSDRHSTRRW